MKPLRSSGLGPIAGIALAHAELVTKSVSVADAAERLGVDPSRIRQRIHARSLYAFKHRGSWLIPSFQFIDGNLIAGIGEVGVRLPTALHPVAVARWFTSPNADLVLAGHAVSPITWLASGGLVEPAAVSAGDADQL